jgi:hypothetical protein
MTNRKGSRVVPTGATLPGRIGRGVRGAGSRSRRIAPPSRSPHPMFRSAIPGVWFVFVHVDGDTTQIGETTHTPKTKASIPEHLPHCESAFAECKRTFTPPAASEGFQTGRRAETSNPRSETRNSKPETLYPHLATRKISGAQYPTSTHILKPATPKTPKLLILNPEPQDNFVLRIA